MGLTDISGTKTDSCIFSTAVQLERKVTLCHSREYFILLLFVIVKAGPVFLSLFPSVHLSKAQLIMSFKVAIIADSRGGFLQHFLNLYNENQNVSYTTLVFKGRRVEELWLQARSKLNSGQCDHVYVLGGIV